MVFSDVCPDAFVEIARANARTATSDKHGKRPKARFIKAPERG
jgi:hypothetical protein